MVTDTAYYHALEDIALLEKQRDLLREALERAADDLDMIACVENNYLAKSGADRCRAALKATEDSA